MIRSTIRTHVRRLAGESSAQFWQDGEVNDAIHFGEQYVGQSIRLPEKVQTFTSVALQREYTTLQVGTVLLRHIEWNGYLLRPIQYELTRHPVERTGNPTHFYLSQRSPQITVGLFPTPKSAQTVSTLTVVEPTTMSADGSTSDIPDMWMWAVIMFGAMVLKFKEKEFNQVQRMAMDMLGKLLEYQNRVNTTQAQQYQVVKDESEYHLDLGYGRIYIP